ncbi:MAG: MlaE family ABC transporter permease [Gammaproteobacteria bacterium]
MNIIGIGNHAVSFVERLGRAGIFLAVGLLRIFLPPYRIYPIIKQIHFMGARSLLVIVVAGIFVGMVVALQFYDTLVRFGSVSLLGAAVGVSLIRELGPVITALVIIGRVGSSVCAEISIMRNESQIDALECMAIDPFRYLIAPRVFAAIISTPLLTAIFITVGVMGGYFVGVILFGVSPGSYFYGMYDAVLFRDCMMGAVKAIVFGTIIIWVATVKGFYLHLDTSGAQGAEGVSKVTTDTVVLSLITVLYADYIVTSIIL